MHLLYYQCIPIACTALVGIVYEHEKLKHDILMMTTMAMATVAGVADGLPGAGIKPENETWRPAGAFGHEWGMRGAAWVDNNLFTEALDYVDLNVTRAVQVSLSHG